MARPLSGRDEFCEWQERLLPGGGRVRLSAGIDRAVLLDVIRVVSTVLVESPS